MLLGSFVQGVTHLTYVWYLGYTACLVCV